jgi:hypothetical protein
MAEEYGGRHACFIAVAKADGRRPAASIAGDSAAGNQQELQLIGIERIIEIERKSAYRRHVEWQRILSMARKPGANWKKGSTTLLTP